MFLFSVFALSYLFQLGLVSILVRNWSLWTINIYCIYLLHSQIQSQFSLRVRIFTLDIYGEGFDSSDWLPRRETISSRTMTASFPSESRIQICCWEIMSIRQRMHDWSSVCCIIYCVWSRQEQFGWHAAAMILLPRRRVPHDDLWRDSAIISTAFAGVLI